MRISTGPGDGCRKSSLPQCHGHMVHRAGGKLAYAGGGVCRSTPFPGPPPLPGSHDGDPDRLTGEVGGGGGVLRYHNIYDSK